MTDTPKDPEPESTAVEAPAVEDTAAAPEPDPETPARGRSVTRLVAFVMLPILALLLAAGAAYFKWQDSDAARTDAARAESVQAAKDITVAMLTYAPDTVDTQLAAVRDQLADPWKQNYSSMVDSVVVPGAKAQQISAVATVAAAASVSAEAEHAVALLFVNQTVTVGAQPPSVTASSVRVTLDKVDGRWLIANYEPV